MTCRHAGSTRSTGDPHTLGATTLALILRELFLLREVDICLIRTGRFPAPSTPVTCAKRWDISLALDAKKNAKTNSDRDKKLVKGSKATEVIQSYNDQ